MRTEICVKVFLKFERYRYVTVMKVPKSFIKGRHNSRQNVRNFDVTM